MKSSLLLLALAMMLGVSAALNLRNQDLVQELKARRQGGKPNGPASGSSDTDSGDRKGPKGGDSKEDGPKGDHEEQKKEYLQFSAMLAYAALAGKCEVAALYVAQAADEAGVTFEEAWNGSIAYIPTLYGACPGVQEFLNYYEMVGDEGQAAMVEAMMPYGLLLQCANLFAEVDTLRLLGFTNTSEDGTPESRVMIHGQPLYKGCMEVFGGPTEETKEVEEDLEKVEEEAGEDKRTVQLRSLLNKLEELLRRR